MSSVVTISGVGWGRLSRCLIGAGTLTLDHSELIFHDYFLHLNIMLIYNIINITVIKWMNEAISKFCLSFNS